MRSIIRGCRWAIALALVSAGWFPARADAPEYQVKAEFVERFTRFIDWPPPPGPPPPSPRAFVLCLIGESPMAGPLQAMIATRKIKDRPAVLRRLSAPEEIDDCQLVLIGVLERNRVVRVLERTANRPILTVGDVEGYAEMGALISFYLDPPALRFAINVRAAKASGLKFSAQLLRLGRPVGGSP